MSRLKLKRSTSSNHVATGRRHVLIMRLAMVDNVHAENLERCDLLLVRQSAVLHQPRDLLLVIRMQPIRAHRQQHAELIELGRNLLLPIHLLCQGEWRASG